MHPPLAQALPKLAAQIDTERPLIARAIADHTTVEINADLEQITLHISDKASYELLTICSQHAYLRQAFDDHGFRAYSLSTSQETAPVNPAPAVNDVTTSGPTPQRTRTMLTLPQRAQLLAWVEAHRADVATDPDTDLAMSAAAALGFPVNASHVRTVRTAAGIAKTKPEPLPELSLADLQARLNAHEQCLDDHAIEATSMNATIQQLMKRVAQIIEHVGMPTPPLGQ